MNQPEKPFSALDQLTPSDILFALWRRIHWVLVTTALVFGITAMVVWRLPDLYRADTLILVDPQKVPEKYVTTTVSMDVAGRLSTISQQIMSSTRLQRIIDTYELYKDLKGRRTQEEIIDKMRADIKVEVVRNFDGAGRMLGAFRIAYQGQNPNVVAQVCNQLASLFIEENLKVREQQAEGTSEFIDTQLALAKKNLEEMENKLREFKLQHVGELPEQAGANMATISRLQAQFQAETDALNRARQQEVFHQSAMATYSGGAPGPDGEPVSASPLPVSESLARLRQQRASVENILQQLTLRYSDTHPDVVRAKTLLDSVKKQIEAEEQRLAAAPPASPAAPPAATLQRRPAESKDPLLMHRSQLKMIQAEIQHRQEEQKRIMAQIQGYQARLDTMPIREQQILDVQRDYEVGRSQYQSLLEKKMAADMASDLEKRQKSERFTILDPARIPEKPYKPNRWAIDIAGFVFGLGLGVGLAFLRELQDSSIKKEEEITSFGLRILARIPPVVTAEEKLAQRRRKLRNWALGTVATAMALGMVGGLVVFLSRRAFF